MKKLLASIFIFSSLATAQPVRYLTTLTELAARPIPADVQAVWVITKGMFTLTNSATTLTTNSSLIASTYATLPAGNWYWRQDGVPGTGTGGIVYPIDQEVFSSDWSLIGDTTEPDPGTPQLGTWSDTQGFNWSPMTQGYVTNGTFVTSGNASPGSIYYLMTDVSSHTINTLEAKWHWTGTDEANDASFLGIASFTNYVSPDIFVHIRIQRAIAYIDTMRSSEGLINRAYGTYTKLPLGDTMTAHVYWQPGSVVSLELNGNIVCSATNAYFGVTPTDVYVEQYYNAGAPTASTDAIALESFKAYSGAVPSTNPSTGTLTDVWLIRPVLSIPTSDLGKFYYPGIYYPVQTSGYIYNSTNQNGVFYGGVSSTMTNWNSINQSCTNYNPTISNPTFLSGYPTLINQSTISNKVESATNTIAGLTLRVVTGAPAVMPVDNIIQGTPCLSNSIYHVYDGSGWIRVSP